MISEISPSSVPVHQLLPLRVLGWTCVHCVDARLACRWLREIRASEEVYEFFSTSRKLNCFVFISLQNLCSFTVLVFFFTSSTNTRYTLSFIFNEGSYILCVRSSNCALSTIQIRAVIHFRHPFLQQQTYLVNPACTLCSKKGNYDTPFVVINFGCRMFAVTGPGVWNSHLHERYTYSRILNF